MEFESIYKQYWNQVFRLCMAFVNDYDLAQDLAQETFISVWKKLPNYRGDAKVGTWIYRIATNNCLRQLEKRKRIRTTDLSVNMPDTTPFNMEPEIQLLYKFIAELPEIDRIIISLELEEVNQSEIAQITGMSAVNVRVRIHRIKERLNKRFEHYEK